MIWMLVDAHLLNMLRTASHWAHIISPIATETSHIVGFAFADNKDLITLNMRDVDKGTEETMKEMESSIDRLEED